MKTVMMVGGGVQQVRAIRFAKELGYRMVVTDRNLDAPCCSLADEAFRVDGHDEDGLASLACQLRDKGDLHGIFTLTELVTGVAIAANAAGLMAAPVRSANICQDKSWAKREWLEHSISTPFGGDFRNTTEAHSLYCRMGGDAIIKPSCGAGGRGVTRIRSAQELDTYMSGITTSALVSPLLMEEYVEGDSYDVNGLFDQNGAFVSLGIVDRCFTPDSFAEQSVTAPSTLSATQQHELHGLLEASARAFGISQGPVKGDAILAGEEFKMLEIAPRLHGPKCSLYALPESGQSPWGVFLASITGGESTRGHPASHGMDHFRSQAISCKPGTIRSIRGVERALELPGIIEVMLFRSPGDEVKPVQDSTDVLGYVLATCKSHGESARATAAALACIQVDVI